jgi:hypothetical protein
MDLIPRRIRSHLFFYILLSKIRGRQLKLMLYIEGCKANKHGTEAHVGGANGHWT